MKKEIKQYEANVYYKSTILSSIVMLCLGILLVIESDTTVISISYVIGSILLLLGGYAILLFFSKKTNELANQLFIVYGLVAVILGVLIIKNPKFIGSIIPFIVGLSFIVKSVSKLKYTVDLKNKENKYWITALVVSILTAICGVVLVFNPFTATTVVVQVLGVIIIVYSVLDIASSLIIRKNVKDIKKEVKKKKKKSEVKEADIIEESSAKDE